VLFNDFDTVGTGRIILYAARCGLPQLSHHNPLTGRSIMTDTAIVGARASASKQSRARKTPSRQYPRKRGIPPPPKFDFDVLADSAWLTSAEVAAVLRRAIGTPEHWRGQNDHPLKWDMVDGKPLYRVRDVRAFLASRTKPGRHPGQAKKTAVKTREGGDKMPTTGK
jgi:hypothetical protein